MDYTGKDRDYHAGAEANSHHTRTGTKKETSVPSTPVTQESSAKADLPQAEGLRQQLHQQNDNSMRGGQNQQVREQRQQDAHRVEEEENISGSGPAWTSFEQSRYFPEDLWLEEEDSDADSADFARGVGASDGARANSTLVEPEAPQE